MATATGAAVGAAGTAVLTTNPAGILVGSLAGGVAGGAVVPDEVSTVEACADNPEICNTIAIQKTVMDFIHWIIGGGVLLILAAWLIPGPQTLWRKKDGKSNRSTDRARQGRRY